MKKKTSKSKGPSNINLTEEELTRIKTLSEYLFMDQYQDTAAYPRFEECFGAFCLEKSIDLPKVFKSLCGKRRKYLTFRRLLISYNQWKNNAKKSNQDFTKFMDLLNKNLLKKPGESIGKIVDKSINYNTNNSQHKKAISQFCVITDEDQNEIKGFQITYDEFFKNNLFLNKEDEKFYISLELTLAADTPTTENAEASFPNMNYRDGITHLGGTIKDGKINFLVFKCRSGKIAFVGKPSGEPFLFGNYGEQLHTIKISVKDGCLIYLKPSFIEVERRNMKVEKDSEEISENFLKQDEPIYEETILENVTNEEEVEKQILQPLMKDDRFYDKLKHTDRIGGRPFFQVYPNVHKFIAYDPMHGKINLNINPVDLISEAAVFISNRHQILSQVKQVLQPKNFLSGLGTLIMGRPVGSMTPGQVLQDPASLTNFLGDMVASVSRSAKQEGKKGIVKGLISGAVSGLSGLFSGRMDQVQQGQLPPGEGNYDYPTPEYPPQNMDMPPYPDNQINPPMGNDNFTYEFNQPIEGDPGYSSAQFKKGKDKKMKEEDKKEENKKDVKNNPDKLKGGLRFGFGGGLGGVFNVMNDVASNIFGFGGGSSNMGGFGNMGNMGGGGSFFDPFGYSQNNYYMPGNGNYYYYDDGSEQREYEERRRQAEKIQRQHEEEQRRKYDEAIIKQKTQKAQKLWKSFYEKYSKDQGIFLIQTIGAVIRGLTIIKNEKMGIKTNYTYEEKQKVLNTLQNNKNIIYMLIRARKEAERRRQEEEMLKVNERELEKMREEEERRKQEEKRKIEEEKRRIEEEKKIAEEKKRIEEEKRKREEERKALEKKIQMEKDKKMKEELQRQEELKRQEEERKRKEEEKRKRELEEQQRIIEEKKRKALEEERKRLEEEQKKREIAQKKAEEERRKQLEEEEKAKKTIQEKIVLSPESLPKINAKLAAIEKLIKEGKQSPETVKQLQEYYNYLNKNKNAIIEEMEKEEARKMAEKMKFDAEEARKRDEAERKRLKEEEDRLIEQKRKEEEEKMKQKTLIESVNNTQIPKDTQIWRHQKLASPNTAFTDELFQPVKKNLCPLNEIGRWAFPEDITQEDLNGWERIQWARAENIFGSKNYQVFYEGINKDDIIQGGLGDCYFLSAVAALCKYPELVEKLFLIKTKSNEHCYGCYYRVNGIWKLVLVDDYFPCYGSWGLNFSFTSTNGNELWVVLLEKAWAKLNGCYAKVIGGEANEIFDVITNTYSEKIKIKRGQEDMIWNKFSEGEKKGYIMTAGTSGDTYNLDLEENGLVPGHAYTIIKVQEFNTSYGKAKLVNIRNPWGNGEWSGEWNDSSSRWNNVNGGRPTAKKNDGSFWMSIEDFCKYYVIVGISHFYTNYLYTYYHVPKKITQQGPFLSKIVVQNDNTHAYICLHQKNPRIILKDGTYQKPVICYLMLVDENYRYIKANSGAERTTCIEVNLNKGNYYLITDINFRFVQNTQHCYNLSSYASSAVGITPETGKNIEEAFKYGIYSYCRGNLSPQSHNGGNLYQSKKSDSEFPFMFCLFDNTNGKYDITLTDTPTYKSNVQNFEFYFEGKNNKATSLSKKIQPGQWDLFVHLPYSFSTIVGYSLKSSGGAHRGAPAKKGLANLSCGGAASNINTNANSDNDYYENKKKENASNENNNYNNNTNNNNNSSQMTMEEIARKVFTQEAEALDDRGYLNQYVYQAPDGYYIGFENGSNRALQMKLILEGLYEVNNPNLQEVPFISNPRSRKLFYLKVRPGNRGDISFMFDQA